MLFTIAFLSLKLACLLVSLACRFQFVTAKVEDVEKESSGRERERVRETLHNKPIDYVSKLSRLWAMNVNPLQSYSEMRWK